MKSVPAPEQRLGLTVVLLMTETGELWVWGYDVVLLNAGNIEQQGSAQDLYGQPRMVFILFLLAAHP